MKFIVLATFLSLLMFSCTDGTLVSDSDKTIVDIEASEYLEVYVKNPVIFQYLSIDRQSQSVSGWIIEKNGDLRSINSSLENVDIINETVQIDYLNSLVDMAGPVIKKVNLEELKDYYSINLLSGRYELNKAIESSEIEEVYQSFILKTQYTTWRGHGECPVFHDPFSSTHSYISSKLEVNSNLKNTSSFSAQIVSWLKTFQDQPAEEGL